MRRFHRKGVTLVLAVAALVVILIMAAYAINVSYMQLVRTELRAATDAAARAGAEALAREDSTTAAIDAAIAAASKNRVGNQGLTLTADDVQLGRAEQQDNGQWEFEKDETPYCAVRISSERNSPLFMFGVTGRSDFLPEQVSTAAFAVNEICLVVDRSHSMCFDLTSVDWSYPTGTPAAPPDPVVHPPHATGSRWASLTSGIDMFIDTVKTKNTTQRVSLVTWGSEITLLHYEGALTGQTFPAAEVDLELTTDLDALATAIHDRSDNVMLGGTDMSAGIDEGVKILTGPDTRNYATKTMIVMTDGKWNQGRDPLLAAADAKQENITIYTVTFLDMADQSDMKAVAAATGGKHYHASDTATLEQAFREIATYLPVVLTD